MFQTKYYPGLFSSSSTAHDMCLITQIAFNEARQAVPVRLRLLGYALSTMPLWDNSAIIMSMISSMPWILVSNRISGNCGAS
jgi:hypothetical protein